jgi:GGDEF domain-containing protein
MALGADSSVRAPEADRRRVLLAARRIDRAPIRVLLQERLPGWQVVESDGAERARFALQMGACDVLLLDSAVAAEPGALEWLVEGSTVPTLFLADAPDQLCTAVEHGATYCLPRWLALAHPRLLIAMLRRTAASSDQRRRLTELEHALADCEGQVSRLVDRLWEATPAASGTPWFTQRHMLDRLQEEVARVERHSGPLTVALGELILASEATSAVTSWAAEQVARTKRRCDVAGQYGPHGFMLLLPRTTGVGGVGACRRLRSILESPPAPLRGPIRACFGVAELHGTETGAVKALLVRAEERLEQAKKSPERVAY